MNMDENYTKAKDISEKGYSLNIWKEEVSFNDMCSNCLSGEYFFDCAICKIKGTFDEDYNRLLKNGK
jgi:hypothetical protein